MKVTHLGTVDSGKVGSPTAFRTDRGTYLIQGWKVVDEEALTEARRRGLPAHEDIVEVPAELLRFLPSGDDVLSRAEFVELFDTFTESAWRLEIQGTYDEPEEREPLRRFLAGEPDDLEWMSDWFAWIREITLAGRQFGRVRVLVEPPTDYQRFELGLLTPPAVDAGEDIRVLPADRVHELRLPLHDFWLFDDARAAVIHFGPEGVAGAELLDDDAAVQPFREIRDRAWDASVPYREWATVNAP